MVVLGQLLQEILAMHSPSHLPWEVFHGNASFPRWDLISPARTAETFHRAVQAGEKARGQICCWPDPMKENLALLTSRLSLQEQAVFYLTFFYSISQIPLLLCFFHPKLLAIWPDDREACCFRAGTSVCLRPSHDRSTDTYSSLFLTEHTAIISGWDHASNPNNLELVPGKTF